MKVPVWLRELFKRECITPNLSEPVFAHEVPLFASSPVSPCPGGDYALWLQQNPVQIHQKKYGQKGPTYSASFAHVYV